MLHVQGVLFQPLAPEHLHPPDEGGHQGSQETCSQGRPYLAICLRPENQGSLLGLTSSSSSRRCCPQHSLSTTSSPSYSPCGSLSCSMLFRPASPSSSQNFDHYWYQRNHGIKLSVAVLLGFRKLAGGQKLPALPASDSNLVFLLDSLFRRKFLVDTKASISVFPQTTATASSPASSVSLLTAG